MPSRYALYYVPPKDSTFYHWGAQLLGRHIYTDAELPPLSVKDNALAPFYAAPLSSELWHTLTADARKYGLHATLKAPFSLAQGRSEAELIASFKSFATQHTAFMLPPLHVVRLTNFFALSYNLEAKTHEALQGIQNINALAQAAVTFFEPYRAPLSPEALQKRRDKAKGSLSPRQEMYLAQFGYPYAFEDFRFHISLCQATQDEKLNAHIQHTLTQHSLSLATQHPCHAITLCKSDAQGVFHVLHTAKLI